MSEPCSRGCKHYRRHVKPCRAEDRADGSWMPWYDDPGSPVLDRLFDADGRGHSPHSDYLEHLAQRIHIGKYGGLETWQACNGCKPRDATHGTVCEGCHLRLAGWFNTSHVWIEVDLNKRGDWPEANLSAHQLALLSDADAKIQGGPLRAKVHIGRGGKMRVKRLAPGSLAWSYDWLAADHEPRQATAGLDKIMQGKKVPPAALALYVHDLRQDIATILGTWLGMVTYELNLDGPPWWRHRVTEAQRRAGDVIYRPEWGQAPRPGWRSFLPQTQAEITDAQRYLAGWLGKVETVPDLVASIYDTAADLMVRVASIAPWRAEPRKLRGVACPECERDALAIFEGDNCVTCRRCNAVFSEERYGIWERILISERERMPA